MALELAINVLYFEPLSYEVKSLIFPNLRFLKVYYKILDLFGGRRHHSDVVVNLRQPVDIQMLRI